MKKIISFLILFYLTTQMLDAQDLVQKKYIVFKTTVIDVQNDSHQGFLATIDDSTLYLSPKKFASTFETINLAGFQKFSYNEINKVSLQRKGSVGSGMVIGGIAGLLVGAIIGASQPVQPGWFDGVTHTGNGIVGAFIGGGIGCLLGAAIGALSHKVFHIEARKDRLIKMQEAMISRLY